MTAAERVRARLRTYGTVNVTPLNGCTIHEDLTALLDDYKQMCELVGELLAGTVDRPEKKEVT